MEPQQVNPTPVPAQPKQNHKIFYILIFVFIALVGSSAYLYFQNAKKEVAQSVPVQNGVEEWKTYRNEEYGFEFKYPADWEKFYGDSIREVSFGTQSKPLDYPYSLGLYIEESFENLKMRYGLKDTDFISYTKSQGYPVFKKKINGIDWICIDHAGDGPGDIIGCDFETSNKNLIFMNFSMSSVSEVEMDQILSTFKFIDENDISTWKTYRNEDYRFEMKLPEDWISFNVGYKDGDLDFSTSTPLGKFSIMRIGTTTKEGWNEYQNCNCPRPSYIYEKNGVVFVNWVAQDLPNELTRLYHETSTILSTFKIINEKYKVVLYNGYESDGKLVEVAENGTEKVLIPSFNKLGLEGEYKIFDKLSFPDNSNELYFYSFLDGTDAPPGGVFVYNLITREFKKLPNVSKYYSNYGDKFLSPDGKFLATLENPDTYSNKQIFLLDLENDKVRTLVSLKGKDSITYCSVKGDCWGNHGDIRWIDNNTIEYKVYDSSFIGEYVMSDYPEIEKRRFTF